MWWYGYGWWWWWIIFVIIFFLLPLGYGWGYRGWGPWYRRRRRTDAGRTREPGAESGMEELPPETDNNSWGWLGVFLWFILIVAIIWGIGAWGWGTW